jgi:hypothetical protein
MRIQLALALPESPARAPWPTRMRPARVYTMRSKEELEFYTGTVYPRHFLNFPLFGVQAHAMWTVKDDARPRAFMLLSYAEGDDPREVAKRYLQSKELADDVRDLDVTSIVGVESTFLIPTASSPLK